MKKIIFLLLGTIIFVGCSPLKMVTEIKYEKPIEMSGKSKSELYGMSNEWMVKTFIDARNVIQFSNLETGTISGKYLMFYSPPNSLPNSPEINFYSIITIYVKDNNVQISVDPQGNLPRYLGMEMYTMEQMKKEAEDLIASYEDYMKTYKKF
jgi:hypothetical protein